MSEHVVLIGTRGWQHAEWVGEFYPDDLPEDWLLGYYGNEYPVVMVPADYWQANDDAIEGWLEDSDDNLQFLAEWPESAADDELKQRARAGLSIIADRVTGVVIPLSNEINDSDWQEYQSLAKKFPLSFEPGADATDEQRSGLLASVAKHFDDGTVNICWHGKETDAELIKKGMIGVCRLEGEIEPKKLRNIMQTMLDASTNDRSLVLIIDGQPPDMKLLANTGIILDLL